MGIAEESLFSVRGWQPRGTVFCVDEKGNTKLFDVMWDDANKKWWDQKLLPSSVLFYVHKILPKAIKEASKGRDASCTPVATPGRVSISQRQPLGTPQNLSSPTAATRAPISQQTYLSPVPRPGKRAFHPSKGRVVRIGEVDGDKVGL